MSQKGVPPPPPRHIITGVKRVVFCYDIVCPYAYLASRLIEELAADYDAKVEFLPVLLSGLTALDDATREDGQLRPEISAAKQTYQRSALLREAARHGVELHFPPNHPVRSVAAMRVLAAVEGAERVRLTHALYRAYWVEARDISNESVLSDCIIRSDIKPERVNSRREHGKEALMENTQRAYDDGAYSVPAFFVHHIEHGHDGTVYSGVDRLHFVSAALGGATDQTMFRVTTDPAPLSPPPAVEFFFDITSPWSFLAFTQLRRIAHLCTLKQTPVLLGALFKAVGASPPTTAMGHNELNAYHTDLQDFSAWWKEPLTIPPFFPVHGALPNRLAVAHPQCAELLFRALWQHGQNVGEHATAVAVLNEAGMKGEELVAAAESAVVKARLRENTQRAEQLGLFGVPTYVVEGTTVVWGQDHLDTLLDILSGWKPTAEAPAPLPSKL